MIKHSAIYLIAKVAPVIASFFTLAIYTRYMSSESYGLYSILLVMALGGGNFLFGWLYVGIMRHWDLQSVDTPTIQRTILTAVLGVTLCVAVIALCIAWWTGQWLLALSFVGLFFCTAFYEAAQRIHSMTQQVNTYALVEIGRTTVTALIGMGLVIAGYQWQGAWLGVVLGVVLALVFSGALWRYFLVNPLPLESNFLKQLLHYGLPLSLSLVFLEIIHISDRILLGKLAGLSDTAYYSVAFNVPHQILMMLTSSLNLAAYPLVIRALEKQGEQVAQEKLRDYFLVLMGVSLPAVVGVVAISPDFIPLLVGENFVDVALALIPWVGIAVLLNCTYLFYVSLAFQLVKKTMVAAKVVGFAAVLNVVLNILLIPEFGIQGAITASILAYVICLVGGFWASRSLLALPLPLIPLLQIIFATVMMWVCMRLIAGEQGVLSGIGKIVIGVLSYGACVWVMNIGQVQTWVFQLWNNKQKAST